jgi:excisionase family DNA binding protein
MGTPTITPRLLTLPQAAAYCSCALWQIRQLVWAKEIPHIKMGKRFVVDRGDLDGWIDRQLRNSGASHWPTVGA